jgi:hypothetical protein
MSRGRGLILLASFMTALVTTVFLMASLSAQGPGTITGVVVDAAGPVVGARVRVRATENLTSTGSGGAFTLAGLTEDQPVEVTAWEDGYYIASAHVTPTVSGVTLTLRRYHSVDHPDYRWAAPFSGTLESGCERCHPTVVAQWMGNAHAGSVSNPRFFSLYNGTDLTGTAQVGPGFQKDFPHIAGNCASCHAPGAGVDGYLTTAMPDVRGVITSGIHCDYCHKIGGVYLNPATGSVYRNTPGTQSQRVLRPPEGDDIFFGPYDDIKDPDTYLPLLSQSQFCAPCHQFSMWGTPIYESYEEWLASPYADGGVTCQACHMPPSGDTTFALPERGGLEHPPEMIPSHYQLGAMSVSLLQETVTMTLEARQALNSIWVTVVITNTGAGHHVPTDYPGRQVILTVTGIDGGGGSLRRQAGPTVPDWGGAQAGSPGKTFAKVLRDATTGEAPVVSYWKQATIVSDNRIPALGSDTSSYAFATPSAADVLTVTAELRFRRAPQALMDVKGWDTPDIIMERAQVAVPVARWWQFYLPLMLQNGAFTD